MRFPFFYCVTFVALLFLSIFCSPVRADISEWSAFSFDISPDEHLNDFFDRFSGGAGGISFSNATDEKADWIQQQDDGIVAITPMEAGVYAVQMLIEIPENTELGPLSISFFSNTQLSYIVNINEHELFLGKSDDYLYGDKFDTKDILAGIAEDSVTKYFITFFVLNQYGNEIEFTASVETLNTFISGDGDDKKDETVNGTPTLTSPNFPLRGSQMAVTPEPTTCLFFGAGLLAIGLGFRRMKYAK